jgi:hypothetical protein
MALSKAYQFRASLNQGLAEKVANLDHAHYPDSLVEIIEAVLLDVTCPRGLPLMASAIECSGVDAGEKPQAAEIVWQGLLLTAILAVGKKPADGLAAGLTYRFDTAHLLLAADTLLTWPFECMAAGGESVRPVAALSSGSRAALHSLASCGSQFSGLLDWEPLLALLSAGCPDKDLVSVAGLPELLRLSYLMDLERWLGGPSWLTAESGKLGQELAGAELSPRLAEVRELLLG